MEKFYNFIKSPQAPVFALATMVLTFFQMYAKLYYYHNSYETGLAWIDIIISLVAAAGLSTMTFIIIIHSKKPWMPIFFAILDFVGGLLFYGKDIATLLESSAYIEIGSALFIPFFKASSIYFVGEIFLHELTEKENKDSQTNQTLTEAYQEIQSTKLELTKAKQELLASKQQHSELENQVSNLKQQLTSTKQSVSSQETTLRLEIEKIKTEKQEIERAFQVFRDEAKEWRRAYIENEITKIKRDSGWQSRAQKVQQYQELNEELDRLK